MEREPTLSIVIPNLNFAVFLEDLLRSLNSSRFRNRIELVVADGGSSDGSVEIARLLLKDGDTLLTGPDSGQADAINKGLSAASGTWFMFQNSDDAFNVEVLDLFFELNPSNELYEVIAYDQDRLIQAGAGWSAKKGFRHSGPIGVRQLSWNIYFTNQATIYNRRLAVAVGFDIGKRFAMDYDFVVRFFKSSNPRVLMQPGVLGLQRIHAATKTNNLQDVCRLETLEIKQREYSANDRLLGLIEALAYHARKAMRAKVRSLTNALKITD